MNLGVLGFLPERPLLVASGINHGSNLGDDVTYSGTVSAAMEGTLLGVPSIAVSLLEGGDFAEAGRVAQLVAARIAGGRPAPQDPAQRQRAGRLPAALRMTRLGHRVYYGQDRRAADPRGRSHYWIGGGEPRWDRLEGTDMAAIHDGFVAVTPVHLDLTHHRALAQMADWSGALSAQLKRGRGARPE